MAKSETDASLLKSSISQPPAAPVVGGDPRYVVVARRYRPRSFEQLIGQDHVGKALCNAIETGRVGHAYLFTGGRGVGKTSTARIFAKALNDPSGPTPHPDHLSDTAQAIDSGEDVDVLEIDGASNRGIDEIRSLRSGVGVRPSRSRFKIYIIDEVHMLTTAAFNALLKTLEEPPPHVKFIFCTTDPEKIPITVLSRCQRFDFAPVQTDQIMERLREIVTAENVQADDEALRLIARRAEGSMRDSQSLLEQVMSFSSGSITVPTVHSMLGTADDARLHEIGTALAEGDALKVLGHIDRASAEGVAAGLLTEQLIGYFRDILIVTLGCPSEMQRHTGEPLHAELKRLGEQWGVQTLLAVVGMIDHTLARIRHSVHGRVLLESLLVQVCHLPNLQSLADLAATAGDAVAVHAEKKNDSPLMSDRRACAEGRLPAVPLPTSPPTATSPTLDRKSTPLAMASAPSADRTLRIDTPQAVAVLRSPSGGVESSPSLAMAAAVTSLAAPGRESVTATAPAPSKSRLRRLREIESHPYVKQCLEAFAGEVTRVDPPRP